MKPATILGYPFNPDTVRAAVRQYAPHGNWFVMAGPANAGRRQAAMQAMLGVKLPRAQCGITALQNVAFAAADIQPDSLNRMEDALAAWAGA